MVKKFLCLIFSVVMLFIATNSFVFAATNKNENSKINFFISVYNDLNDEYIVENTKITIDYSVPLLETIDLLQEYITQYDNVNNQLIKIVYDENKTLQSSNGSTVVKFVPFVNKTMIEGDQLKYKIKDGDIVEWIYQIVKPQQEMESINTNIVKQATTQNTNQISVWNDNMSDVINDACEWLKKHDEDSGMYLTAFGCAEKSVDIDKIHALLADIRNTKLYEKPTDLARHIMSTTFCGYNASDISGINLIEKLSSMEDITKAGVFGAINSLLAYDTNDYVVDDKTLNSREKLIDIILSFQKGSGGFSIFETSDEDIDTTAMAITVISKYKSQERVKSAIQKGFQYLSEKQTDNGGFAYKQTETSESLSQVIISLQSAGKTINDVAFSKGNKNLIELLLDYQNKDGGFSHLIGNDSNVIATEQAIIALSSIKRNGYPYKVSNSIKVENTTKLPVTEQVKEEHQLFYFITFVILTVTILIIFILDYYKKRKN